MEVSEMTNEELAKNIEYTADELPAYGGFQCADELCEAAARLRTMDELYEDNVRTSKRVDCQKTVIIDLRRRLNVAVDALEWCLEQANEIGAASLGKIEQAALSMSMAGCVRRCERALDAIREEGAEHDGN